MRCAVDGCPRARVGGYVCCWPHQVKRAVVDAALICDCEWPLSEHLAAFDAWQCGRCLRPCHLRADWQAAA